MREDERRSRQNSLPFFCWFQKYIDVRARAIYHKNKSLNDMVLMEVDLLVERLLLS